MITPATPAAAPAPAKPKGMFDRVIPPSLKKLPGGSEDPKRAAQTPAAANDILTGTSPLAGAQTSAANNWVEYAVIGGFVLAAFAFFKTGGKSS